MALERSGDLLDARLRAFGAVTSANTNDTLQDDADGGAPKLAAHSDAIYLNEAICSAACATIYETRATAG